MQKRQERFIVSHEEKEHGPFTREEITERLKSGEFSVVDFVYVEAQSDWITLLEFCPDVTPGMSSGTTVSANVSATTSPAQTEPVKAREPTPEVVEQVAVERVAVEPKPVEKSEQASPVTASITPRKEETLKKSARTTASADKIELKGGMGTIDLVQFAAGQVRLTVQALEGKNLERPQPTPVTVKPAPAAKITLKGPSESVVGEACVFRLMALDQYDNRDTSFSGSITVSVSGSAEGGGAVRFSQGEAQVTITDKVAESVTIRMEDAEKRGLDVSLGASVQFVAGPAARFVLVAPEETVAGEPLKVTVKAVDAFGNLATGFGGEVKVEVDPAEGGIQRASGN